MRGVGTEFKMIVKALFLPAQSSDPEVGEDWHIGAARTVLR